MKKALVFREFKDFHDPVETTDRFASLLERNGYEVIISDSYDCFSSVEYLLSFDLIVFSATISEDHSKEVSNIIEAVSQGVGLAGCHGGLCDAFRFNTDWQFLTGGQWVAHPGGDKVRYTVNITDRNSPVTEGIGDFEICSEQYYLHVDPSIEVLATTTFDSELSGKEVVMPACWIRRYKKGQVFYLSVGHTDDDFNKSPEAEKLMKQGMIFVTR